MPLFWRVFLAILAGFLLGEGFLAWLVLMPLARQERQYLREFYTALKSGSYTEHEDDEEGSDEDDENRLGE